MLNRYYIEGKSDPFTCNTLATPWVEGVPGNGEGETLEVSFTYSNDFIIILNGYIDPAKTHLFKQNGKDKNRDS